MVRPLEQLSHVALERRLVVPQILFQRTVLHKLHQQQERVLCNKQFLVSSLPIQNDPERVEQEAFEPNATLTFVFLGTLADDFHDIFVLQIQHDLDLQIKLFLILQHHLSPKGLDGDVPSSSIRKLEHSFVHSPVVTLKCVASESIFPENGNKSVFFLEFQASPKKSRREQQRKNFVERNR